MPIIVRYDILASDIIHEPETITIKEDNIDEKVLYLDDKLLVVVEKKDSYEKPKTG